MAKVTMTHTRHILEYHLWIQVFSTMLAIAALSSASEAKTLRVPDDHRTIQLAIDAADAGDTILVNAGTYKERIQLRRQITVRSEGDDTKGKLGLLRAERTIIDCSNGEESMPGATMAEGSVLDGFTITGVGTYDESLWNKHHATHGNNQSHEHIGAPGTAGISSEGFNCVIAHNIVHHIGYTGIAISGHSEREGVAQVTSNVCHRNMGGGIGIMKNAKAHIEGNTCFQNFYAGIGHDNASPVVMYNVCYENVRAGIGISEGSCPIVKHNRCYRNRRAGIGTRTNPETRPLIEDNDCYENDMAGIGTDEEASPVIRGNRCYRNKMAGIGVRQHSHAMLIGNECYENETSGIGQESNAVTTLIGNHCHHNKKSGLGFAACDNGRSLVVNNTVSDNALVAAGINAGWTVTFSKNKFSRTAGMPPLIMIFGGADVTLSENSIKGGGVSGIRVAGKVRMIGNRLEGNGLRKTGPPNFAVWGLPHAEITMLKNSVSSWRHALHATESAVHAAENEVRDFHSAAFAIVRPPSTPVICGNKAYSTDTTARILTGFDSEVIAFDNSLIQSTATPEE